MAAPPSNLQTDPVASSESVLRAIKVGRQLTLLDTVIIILASCSIVIFVFTIGAKFLHQDTFDKLPDFIKNSYTALWSAGVVAGGALVGSVIDALSTRESTKGSFILYIMGTTILLMALIVGTIELARSVDDPRFIVPSGATEVSVTSNTARPVHFYMQNRFNVGNQARIQGTYEVKDGELTGQVLNSEIEPFPQGAVAPSTQMTSISIHICYLGAQNHLPVFTQTPQFPIDSNREVISTTANMQQPFPIPDFKFKIDVANLTYVSPPYLCAFVDGQQNFHLTYY
jgi:hypothetical protein